MLTPPSDLADAVVSELLSRWGLQARTVEHAALGFGSHHWVAETTAGRWFVTGDRVGAAELLRLGVVQEVVADDAVLARCRERCAEIAAWPAAGVATIKSSMRAASLGTSARDWFASFAATGAPPPLRA